MCARRVIVRKYFLLGFAVIAAGGIAAGTATEVLAQDLNLQSQIETFSPPFIAQPQAAPEVKPEVIEQEVSRTCQSSNQRKTKTVVLKMLMALPETKTRNFTQQNVDSILNRLRAAHDPEARQQLLMEIPKNQRSMVVNVALAKMNRNEFCNSFVQPGPVKIKVKSGKLEPQATRWRISFTTNPTYESNVLKSNQKVVPDESFGFGGGFQYTAGVGVDRPLDIVSFSAGTGSARYSQNPSKSFDSITASAAYQYFIDGRASDGTEYLGNGKILFHDSKKDPIVTASSLITIDTLLLGFQNTASFATTFHNETADFFSPQAVITRQNIELPGGRDCYSAAAKKMLSKTDPNLGGFCNYLDVAFAVSQTFSDVAPQQNASAAISANLGHRFKDSDFVLTLQTIATGKTYENFAGGRRDLQLQVGPTLRYSPGGLVNASLAVNYYQLYSSVSSATWHGFVVQPTFTIAFSP